MTLQAALSALVGLALMLAVAAVYVALARRFRFLWHPLSIVVAVGTVGVIVTVLGELLWGGGWERVPAMLRRSAIGGFGWGLVIAPVVWVSRRAFGWWTARRAADSP
jgi:hypothetical protein